jgi:hypothetical protein
VKHPKDFWMSAGTVRTSVGNFWMSVGTIQTSVGNFQMDKKGTRKLII